MNSFNINRGLYLSLVGKLVRYVQSVEFKKLGSTDRDLVWIACDFDGHQVNPMRTIRSSSNGALGMVVRVFPSVYDETFAIVLCGEGLISTPCRFLAELKG